MKHMGIHFSQPNKKVKGKKNPNWKGGKIKCKCHVCGDFYFVFKCKTVEGRSKYCSKRCQYLRHPHSPTRDSHGYMWLFKPNHPHSTTNGYIREHRYVIEQEIGRFLSPKEVVHHKNGIKSDNRIENLQLFENKGKHMSYHHSVKIVELPF